MAWGRLTIVACLAAIVVAMPARAEDPPLVNWPAFLPATTQSFTPSTFENCKDGAPDCIDRTLAEMRRRLAIHDAACSDNALFGRNYLMVTEFIADLIYADPPFYEDDRYLAHEDAVFAELYFRAEDNWRAGRREQVPEAWRIAFGAADAKSVQGAGNLMLGINAHVQRDMPYLLAGLGLVTPDGRSRKPDHDKGNEVLNTAYDDVLAQAIAEDDPDLKNYDIPGTQADNFLLFQTIAGWREGVWRNAERLVAARSDAERKMVADSIEAWAATSARGIERMFAYGGPFTRDRRDALCAKRRERARHAQQRAAAGRPCPAPRVTTLRVGRRAIRGRATGCGLQRVEVSVEKRTGGRCRYAKARGGLSAPRSCRLRSWLPARGTTRWSVRLRDLPRGRYVVRVRAGGAVKTRRARL